MTETALTPVVVRGYSESRFQRKLARFARIAGRIVVERALRLYYAARDPHTPPSAKKIIYAALAYFIVPFDLIPDLIPGIGFVDDLGTLVAALLAVSAYVSPEIKAHARAKTIEWLGEA